MHSMEPYAANGIKRKRRRNQFFGANYNIGILKEILSKIIKSESGIKKVILVDRTGLTISNVSKFNYFQVDIDGIGAIASAVYCASEDQGKSLELGDLEIVTTEFSGGKIFTSACGTKMMLTIISEPDISIGLIRLILKSSAEELKSIANEDDDRYPYPYIFKPPVPPGDLGVETQSQVQKPVKEEELEIEFYCKYCGCRLKKEQKFCRLCGNKVEL
ncbi:MAG: roadblock/LC7 domain-containing protein [Promethearchaeota archaeon]